MADRSKARRRWLWKNGHRKCHYCGVRLTWTGALRLTADHVIPVSKGGTHKRRNLVAACEGCNRGKGAGRYADFAAPFPAPATGA